MFLILISKAMIEIFIYDLIVDSNEIKLWFIWTVIKKTYFNLFLILLFIQNVWVQKICLLSLYIKSLIY